MTFENYENLCISPLIFKMKYNDSNLTPFFLLRNIENTILIKIVESFGRMHLIPC